MFTCRSRLRCSRVYRRRRRRERALQSFKFHSHPGNLLPYRNPTDLRRRRDVAFCLPGELRAVRSHLQLSLERRTFFVYNSHDKRTLLIGVFRISNLLLFASDHRFSGCCAALAHVMRHVHLLVFSFRYLLLLAEQPRSFRCIPRSR